MNTSRTLRQRIAEKLTHNLIAALLLATVGIVGSTMTTTTYEPRPEVTTSPSALLAANDCWTGEAPADVEIPGHVVVSIDGEARLGGDRLVGKALAQTFDGADHGLTVFGFCR